MNTPSELKSNADGNIDYNHSDQRKHSNNSKINVSNMTNKTIDKIMINSKNTMKEKLSAALIGQENLDDIKVTDETGSRNVSVSNTSVHEEQTVKRKSQFNYQSRLEERKSEYIPANEIKHLNTVQEKMIKNKLVNMEVDTMKNIPTPQSFVTSDINNSSKVIIGEVKTNVNEKYKNQELETIHDDNSEFKSDVDFNEGDVCKESIEANLTKSTKKNKIESQSSVSDEDSYQNKKFVKQDTLGCKEFEQNKETEQSKKMDTQQTPENFTKTMPEEKLNSNFSLNKSDTSDASKLTKINKNKSSNKSDSKGPSLYSKKRMTTFVKQPQTFFAISEVKNHKMINRKKSTSNFL